MRKLLIVLTGILVAGLPGVASAGERSKDDDKITAQRDSDGRRSGYSHPDDENYRNHFRRDRRYRNGYSKDSYGDPGDDRRARKREQECEDSYYYDPSFYNRYCRSAYSDRSGSQPAPQTQSPSPDSTTPGDNPPDSNQQPGPDQSPPPTGYQHGTPDGSSPPDATPPPADSQPAPPPSQRAGAPSNARRDDRTPAWAGYATAPAGPAGPAQPAEGSF